MPVEPASIIWTLFTLGLGSVLVLIAILIPFLIVMHNILYKQLDPLLFKEPWFNSAQLIMFKSWPLSFIKSVIYMFLIAYPNYIRKKKRFNQLETVPTLTPRIKTACKIYTVLHVAMILIGLNWLLFIFSVFAIDNWF